MAVIDTATWSLGEKIRKARRDAHMEQEDLARALTVSRPLVSRWENDRAEPSVSQLINIALATGAAWLLHLDGTQSPCIDEWPAHELLAV